MAARLGFFVVCFSLIIALSDSSCQDSTSCEAKCSGNHIDLSKLVKSGTRYNATALDKNEYSFLFDLCDGSQCGDPNQQLVTAAVCQWKLDHSRSFSLGSPSDITWASESSTSFNVTYSGNTPGDGTLRSAVLMFVHGKDKVPDIQFEQEVDAGTHTFYFTITVNFNTGGNIAGPVGWVLIALALIGLIIYFVAGSLFMYFARGARGVEIIPNFVFWKSFPFLIVEGCLFVISPCRRLAKRGSDYEKI